MKHTAYMCSENVLVCNIFSVVTLQKTVVLADCQIVVYTILHQCPVHHLWLLPSRFGSNIYPDVLNQVKI